MDSVIQKPSPNFDSRGSNVPKYICLHIMAGTLVGTDSWFANPISQVSAHYGVGFNGEIHQYVDEKNSAWANGFVKNPTAKIVLDNLNVSQNKISLSIENEGQDLAKAPEAQLKALVRLIRCLAGRWGIPLDREHIIGHFEVNSIGKPNCPSPDHTVMDRVVQLCQQTDQVVVKLKAEIQEVLDRY